MASSTIPISQSKLVFSKQTITTHFNKFKTQIPFVSFSLKNTSTNFQSYLFTRNHKGYGGRQQQQVTINMPYKSVVVFATSTTEKQPPNKKRYPGESKGFVEEMRFVAMKLHTKDQSKEGEKEADVQPIMKWEPSIQGYLRFLVDSKVVYDTLETIIDKAAYPSYAEFRNTGLERSEKLAKDLEWFKGQGHEIPEPSAPGLSYAHYLKELSEKDPQAFLCHFYNVYFAHTAGGRMIGKKVMVTLTSNGGACLKFKSLTGLYI
ncbi:hypothetical protein AQUCO_00100890v1 [Aquilegia coerulea]|uniref:heme oxygenase (biliverdin-producing) n=1 Tax=Aquilegia coerulea TaxID=218851 RepID=A0A2G5FCL1_AQUCA|nr:hypothetical protein AQUCO_00100890v1 [Aquilegia coerulea]